MQILLVEDNPGDAYLIQHAFKIANVPVDWSQVDDGVAALSFLRRENNYREAPRPQFVILDLNLPLKSGVEVLGAVRADESFNDMPVAIFSNSKLPKDVETCSRFPNCRYFGKPPGFKELVETVRAIISFAGNS